MSIYPAPTTMPEYINPFFSTQGFKGSINMQPRDAMTFATIEKLSNATNDVIEAELIQFRDLTYKEFGGKTITRFLPTVLDDFPEERKIELKEIIKKVYTPKENELKFISEDNMKAAYENCCQKPRVKAILDKFSADNTGEYRVLSTVELIQRVNEYSEFLIVHSSIVNKQKVLTGQYNTIAALDKILNPLASHVVIVHHDKIMACGMWVKHADTGYGGDYVVHPQYRNQGMGEVLGIKMYEELIKQWPDVKGITFIGGAHGTLPVGNALFGENGFKSQTINAKVNPTAQEELGIYVNYVGAGPRMLKASHRVYTDNLDVVSSLDDEAVLAIALQQIAKSPDSYLGAKQPLPQHGGLVSTSMYSDSKPKITETNVPEKRFTIM